MKRMRKGTFIVAMILIISVFLTACSGNTTDSGTGDESTGAGDTDSIVLKLGHVVDANNAWHKAALKFGEIVEEKTDGEITVEVFPSSSLGNDRDLVEGMQMGTVDMGLIAGVLGNFYEPIQLLELPYIFNDQEHLRKVIYGDVGEQIKEGLYEEANIVGLEFWERSPRQTTSNKEINTVEDLDGLKIRVPEIPPMVSAWKAMGANPTPMAFGEVYTGLQQGTIDAQENPLSNIVAAKIEEVQTHIANTNHVYGYVMHVMSGSTWNKLTPEQQEIVREAAAEAREYQNSLVEEEEKELEKYLQDKGIIFTNPELEGFKAKAQSVHDEFADQFGRDIYNAIIEAGK